MSKALVFPGQGSQAVGMGKSLSAAFPVARDVFAEVDEALGRSLSAVMWDGPPEALNLTTNAQPALMAHSVAAARVLEAECGLRPADCAFVAGHSLGEYSALCVSGALPLAEAARLLQARGEEMQAAAPGDAGAMVALLGISIEQAEAAIAAVGGEGVLEIANDNAPGQVVLSGDRARVEALVADARTHGVKMARMLPVSGPFHSSLMAPAAEAMRERLRRSPIGRPTPPLVANVTAQATDDPAEIVELLVRQITGRVRWTESVAYMADAGVDAFVEIGPGRVLVAMIKRIAKDATLASFAEPDDLKMFRQGD